jgi:hypothetical protein
MLAGTVIHMHNLAKTANKPNPKLAAYLRKNGLSLKKITEVSDEHAEINNISSEKEFWNRYYKSGLDAFHESVEHSLNMETFGLMADMVRSKARVFEPCCRSGYFGAWLASSRQDIDYMGMDINPIAIQKAKELALSNAVSPARFVQFDYRQHFGRHDIIIGRNITNKDDFEIDLAAIKKITSIADEIAVLHFTYEHRIEIDSSNLSMFYNSYNFVFEQASGPFETATGSPAGSSAVAFVYRAFKKPDY